MFTGRQSGQWRAHHEVGWLRKEERLSRGAPAGLELHYQDGVLERGALQDGGLCSGAQGGIEDFQGFSPDLSLTTIRFL